MTDMTHLNREQNRPDLKSGAPLVLEDVETDPAQLVDIGVVDTRDEPHLNRHGLLPDDCSTQQF